MSARDWPPFDSPDWRPLFDAIEFFCRRFRSVRKVEAELYAKLVSGDLPSIWEREVEGRVVREPLTCWKEISFDLWFSNDNPGKFSGSDDDIEIVLGNELLNPHSIFVWWPDVERLREPTVAQPKPAAQPEPVEPWAPKAAAAKTPTPASGASKRAATPKQKSAKRRIKRAKRQTGRVTMKRTLTNAALNRLRDEHPDKYSRGFSKAQPAIVMRQIKPIWAEVCKAEGVSSEDYPLPKWDMVARAIGRRKDPPRR